jgi:hypothetical protein
LVDAEGAERAALIVYRRDGDQVQLFWASEMTMEMPSPQAEA